MIFFSCSAQEKELKVLQFNIWQEGTVVEVGFDAIVDNILNVNPDLVTFSEVRNYNNVNFIRHITDALKKEGAEYYGNSSESTGIISKYPILNQIVIFPYINDQGSVIKAIIDFHGKKISLYSAHLDYKHYACYLPRGYSGYTWEKLDKPVTDADSILKANRKSKRLDAVKEIISDAEQDIEKGHLIIIGGDFNEPSHLDWTSRTRNLWDHNDAIVEWDCSKLLYEQGYKDAYREYFPDEVNYPGFTFPSDNPDVPISKLTWAPDADERERIDFIYYYPSQNLTLKDVTVVGPSSSIVRSNRMEEEESDDLFIAPDGVWPTDHKAVLAWFIIK